MVYLAGEPIPFFWPMRNFITRNPLRGFEHLPFAEGVEAGTALFGGRGYLSREQHRAYLADGDVDPAALQAEIEWLVAGQPSLPGIDLERWVDAMLTRSHCTGSLSTTTATSADVHAALAGSAGRAADPTPVTAAHVARRLRTRLLGDRPVHEAVDALYGTRISEEVDSIVIKSCLSFFDEGQSAWGMPGREAGFFHAWRALSLHNVPLEPHGRYVRQVLSEAETPEGVIAHVLGRFEIPEEDWTGYFTRELARLRGWSGFIRWRSNATRYHWNTVYPADLVDLVAIRLTLAAALLASSRWNAIGTRTAIAAAIENRPEESYLRHEFFSRRVIARLGSDVERALMRGRPVEISRTFARYVEAERSLEARRAADRLEELAMLTGEESSLAALDVEPIGGLLAALAACERHEGQAWLRAMETTAADRLLAVLTPRTSRVLDPDVIPERPFAQALFCIDTRSEFLRRHLEGVGDYETFGIAGFFGVPVSLMELGKGSETHLSPVIVTPQNLVLEIAASGLPDEPVVAVLGEAVHQLKESVLTPFVTVEAVGLLFGIDMVGRTLAPRSYAAWRRRLDNARPRTHLLLDKLDRAQADSLVRAVQRGVIVRAVEEEVGVDAERVTDAIIRELREAALEHGTDLVRCRETLGLSEDELAAFVQRLRSDYQINPIFAGQQLERLGRIGFTLDEQTNYALQALRSIGLTTNFSRFVLLVGHGSTSANNPYESSLDCGACGGSQGLTNARVLAQMANKPQVRRRLRAEGIAIPDDTWFLPALHDTTTDEVALYDLELIPPAHLVYIDRLRTGLNAASRRSSQERVPTLGLGFYQHAKRAAAPTRAQRNSVDWSQVRPEWGLSRNAHFVIGTRDLTRSADLSGRTFLHSYDYRVDPRRRLLENILTGPLVVAQWINMEYYFSTVDNRVFGSGSKVSHNVSGRFGVMTGNVSDLRTGLPAQTVLKNGRPYHQPIRLITIIEAPFDHARRAVEGVIAVKRLVTNEWIRITVLDPQTGLVHVYSDGSWTERRKPAPAGPHSREETAAHERY